MIKKEKCLEEIKKFSIKNALDIPSENVITTIHLMNKHGLDKNAALDQSSRSGNDNGIDGWFYDDKKDFLYIYQSKLTESKAGVYSAFIDLERALQWLVDVVVKGELLKIPGDNHSLYNLYSKLSNKQKLIKKIEFIIISLYDSDFFEDSEEYKNFEKKLIESKLNKFIYEINNGRLKLNSEKYDLETSIPLKNKKYSINRIEDSSLNLRSNAHLDLAYVTLYSLVDLYRQRGDILFEKNVRLSLVHTKEAKERLVNPMENTLELITEEKLSPDIFPFYHLGVTIAATMKEIESNNVLSLESPSIINGCQTIIIANNFLKKLEELKNQIKIELFKKIKVIAKVVIGITDDELREITNSNNRQNQIDNWQLFSNEPIHIEIESCLKDIGIFYERQKGKFDTIMKKVENAKFYFNTNGTYIKVMDLGQVICLCRKKLQWSAKPSEIFLNKDNHYFVFDKLIHRNPKDIIFTCNLYKCLKNALNNYLKIDTHASNNHTQIIYKKPLIKAFVYYLGILNYYQKDNKFSIRKEYSRTLLKKASPLLSEDIESFYVNIITKTRDWYLIQSDNLDREISYKKLEIYFDNLAIEKGIDFENGLIPFSERTIDWSQYIDSAE